jgi:hypothetical protein
LRPIRLCSSSSTSGVMETLTEDTESVGVMEEDDDIVDAIFGRSQVYE